MVRRPIIWGLIFFGVGVIGWVFSVVLAAITLGRLSLLANLFGWGAAISLAAGIVGEIIIRINKSKNDIMVSKNK